MTLMNTRFLISWTSGADERPWNSGSFAGRVKRVVDRGPNAMQRGRFLFAFVVQEKGGRKLIVLLPGPFN
ncbi:MAG: hypothetical protein A2X67_09280 [Ignavibacteria bacterium GWA2_55_11]|nr:MAG: hypothetical protein A2X67_09280 [Ignavibacteria bacterium GWA2_55_11]OGU46515.1 MAG: hypothetical protein A2X68_01110 [Ignavibacteria bacterium GWC2_56_12]